MGGCVPQDVDGSGDAPLGVLIQQIGNVSGGSAVDGRGGSIADPVKFGSNMELDQLSQSVDYFNIMAYDYHGAWENTTNFHAPLYASPDDPSSDITARTKFNADQAVQGFLSKGVPADKMFVAGWGEFRPAVSNGPKGEAAGNRRVEIYLTRATNSMSNETESSLN